MNLKLENKDGLEKADIYKLFQEYNSSKYNRLLHRFRPEHRNNIRSIPLFFHVNLNLLPGYVNDNVPHTVYDYLPDAEVIDNARLYNSKFDYDINTPLQDHSIEAIYIQDNLKTGRFILWIIYHPGLTALSIELLKEKTSIICKWLESMQIRLIYHVVTSSEMPLIYWGTKYESLRPDKSIFLDDFYSESILLAGKFPAWWLIPPDKENQYDQLINDREANGSEKLNNAINFGSIANTREQDYLAAAIINLINIQSCPEESWLNILDLCHKLNHFPSLNCTSYRIKKHTYDNSTNNIQYQDIYCNTINETIDAIYGREKSILITRILKLIASQHKTGSISANIYRNLLSSRPNNDSKYVYDGKSRYEYIAATENIFMLIREAFEWFIRKTNKINSNLIPFESVLYTLTNNLLRRISTKDNYIPVTNIHSILSTRLYDICFKHNTQDHKDNWSLIIIDNALNEIEIRQDENPVALAAWGVFNRIIDNKTRISVNCPYMSIKQTLIADISSILLNHLSKFLTQDISLQTLISPESPVNDILIINAPSQKHSHSKNKIHIYRFCITNFGEIIYSEYTNPDGFMKFVCESLSTDLNISNNPHNISIYSTNNGAGYAFAIEARHIYDKVCKFAFKSKLKFTHFIDTSFGNYYAITKYEKTLTPHYPIKNTLPEEHFQNTDDIILMNFSDDIQDSKVLNYVYKNNIYGYIQVFYLIQEHNAHIYILDEKGIIIRFSQPFYERQIFINQWIMFLYNTRNRIKSLTGNVTNLPNIEICELTYRYNNYLVKTHLNSSSIPKDSRYFDLKVAIHEESGNKSITLKCEDIIFTSEIHGNNIYIKLRDYLSKHFKSGLNNPIYLTDIEVPLSRLNIETPKETNIRYYIKYKINIERRLNTIINQL